MKICMVASSGGHWEELMCLKDITKDFDAFFVTEEGGQADDSSLKNIVRVPQINRHEKGFLRHFLKLVSTASKIIKKEKPDVIITTGALICVPFCYIAKLKRKKFINEGKKVLFLGLPCQSAAVKNYIGENELLYTADLICHGTPSPKLLESYLKDFGKDLSLCADKLSFRSSNTFRLEENGKPFVKPVVKDDYTFLFLRAAIYTENCFNCRYAATERVSDLTLGDSWGTELPMDEASKGVSIALCQSKKGIELLKNADIKLMDTDLELAVKYNHQLKHPSVKPEGSERFFGVIKKGGSFKNAFRKTYPKVWVKNKAKAILKRG